MNTLKRLLKNPLSFTGFLLLIFFITLAVAGPWLAPPEKPCPYVWAYLTPDWILQYFVKELPCRPYTMPRDGFKATPLPPDWSAWQHFPPDWHKHPLGTTENRYDIYYGLIWGTRNALLAGVIIVAFELLIGLLIGAVAGFYGRGVDQVLMRLVDLFFALPGFLATLILIAVLGKGLDKIILSSIIFGWPSYARLIRGDILSIREWDYVQAARALGTSDARIIFRHVLPNAIYPVLIFASLDIGSIVLGLSGFSFLGLGQPEDYADWGQMISFARDRIIGAAGGDVFQYWYTVVFPGLAILLFVLSWNLIGDAVRDILDPRIRRARGG